MSSNILYVFLEGLNDQTFFEKVIEPKFRDSYTFQYWQFAGKSKEKTKKFINSLESMKAKYLVIADLDDKPCFTAKKASLKESKFNDVADNKIFVVKKEIESWYFAGIKGYNQKSLKFNYTSSAPTEDFTKEDLLKILPNTAKVDKPKNEKIKTHFLIEMCKNFDIETAKVRNRSFKYFIEKLEQM